MKKIIIPAVFVTILWGCSENECRDGEHVCEGNMSKSCMYGEWRIIECKGNAPVCDSKRGCQKADTIAQCGNGAVEIGEECDGNLIQGKTCRDVNAALQGTPVCTKDCKLDYSGCTMVKCVSGDKRCSEGILQMCSEDDWVDVQNCVDSGLVCDEVRKTCEKGQ